MKKMLVLILAALMLLPVTVIAEAPLEGGFMPVIPLGVAHQFWQAVRLGAEEAAREYGVEIVFDGPQEETMVDKQVDILRANLANENLIAVCIAAIDEQSVTADLTAVKAEGIPVVGFDAGAGKLADVHCSTSNYAAGELAAENAIRLLEGKGKVGVVGHSQTVPDAVARVEGFVAYVQANSEIEVVDLQYGDGDHLRSADIAKSMLLADPEIDLLYASNEGACVGAYNGLKEIDMIGEVMLIGFDSSAAMKAGIRAGEIAGAITQDPVGMGYKTVQAACKLVLGEEVEGEVDADGIIVIDTGCYWYDATNMDEAHIEPLLYD